MNDTIVIKDLLVKANEARKIAESPKTKIAGISIQWAVYNTYVDAAKMVADATGVSHYTVDALNKNIWDEVNAPKKP